MFDKVDQEGDLLVSERARCGSRMRIKHNIRTVFATARFVMITIYADIITSDMEGLVWGEPELPEDVFSFC